MKDSVFRRWLVLWAYSPWSNHPLDGWLWFSCQTTPDYVPIYGTIGEQNTYDLYYKNIVTNQKAKKILEDGYLVLTWEAAEGEGLNLPIVVYKDSILTLNGKELNKDDYDLSTIGTPTVSSQEGQNKLVLSYKEPGWLFVALLIPIIVLGVIGLQWLYTKISIKKVA